MQNLAHRSFKHAQTQHQILQHLLANMHHVHVRVRVTQQKETQQLGFTNITLKSTNRVTSVCPQLYFYDYVESGSKESNV